MATENFIQNIHKIMHGRLLAIAVWPVAKVVLFIFIFVISVFLYLYTANTNETVKCRIAFEKLRFCCSTFCRTRYITTYFTLYYWTTLHVL